MTSMQPGKLLVKLDMTVSLVRKISLYSSSNQQKNSVAENKFDKGLLFSSHTLDSMFGLPALSHDIFCHKKNRCGKKQEMCKACLTAMLKI